MRRSGRLVLYCLVAAATLGSRCRAAELAAPLDQMKTAFLYQFTKYVEWPSLPETFTIGIVGNSGMAPHLEELRQKKKIKDKPVALVTTAPPYDLEKTQIVLVATDDQGAVAALLQRAERLPVLLIGHGTGLAEKGVTINFYVTEDGRLRFEINRRAAEAAGLIVSSQLLKMAKIVE